MLGVITEQLNAVLHESLLRHIGSRAVRNTSTTALHSSTMLNASNASAIGCDANTASDVVVVTLWTLLLVYGLLLNVLIVIGIWRNNTTKNSTSYWLILVVAACDILMIMICLLHLLPAVMFHDRFVTLREYRNYFAIFVYNIFWYTEVLALGAMAFNRFVIIVFPATYKSMFSREKTLWMIAGLLAGGIIVAIPALFPCCHALWDHNCYATLLLESEAWETYGLLDVVLNSIVVFVMIILYGWILIKVRQSRLHLQRFREDASNGNKKSTASQGTVKSSAAQAAHKREIRLFIQFFLVSIVFVATFVTWQWATRVEWAHAHWLNFAMTSLYFINNATHPTVYMIFNQSLRNDVIAIVCAKCSQLPLLGHRFSHQSPPASSSHNVQSPLVGSTRNRVMLDSKPIVKTLEQTEPLQDAPPLLETLDMEQQTDPEVVEGLIDDSQDTYV